MPFRVGTFEFSIPRVCRLEVSVRLAAWRNYANLDDTFISNRQVDDSDVSNSGRTLSPGVLELPGAMVVRVFRKKDEHFSHTLLSRRIKTI